MKLISRAPVPALLATGTVLLLIPCLFFGFHYWDIGWNVTKSWLIVAHPSEAFWEFSWLSSMVGGLWMKLTSYSLIWLRIGYIVSTTTILLIAYATLRLYYEPKASATGLIPALLLFIAGFEQFILNYYTVPPLFALTSMYFLLRSHGEEQGTRILKLAFLSGFFFAFVVQARIPALVFGVIFPATALIERYHSGERGRFFRRLSATALGFVAGTGFLMLLLHLTGNLGHAVEGIRRTYLDVSSYSGEDNIHHPLRLLTDTLIRYAKMVAIGGLVLFGAYVWKRWFPRREPSAKDFLTILVLLLTAAVTSLFVIRSWGSFPPSFGILTVFFAVVASRQWKTLSSDKLILYTVALLYLFCMNLGSSNPGVGSLKYTAWLFIPVTLIESSGMSSPNFSYRLMRWILVTNIVAVTLSFRLYFDTPVLLHGTTFRTDALRGIGFSKEGVAEFEGLMTELKLEGLHEGDTTLCYIDVPLLHFTTRTIPALGNPWISDRSVGLPSLRTTRTMLANQAVTRTLPKFVVRARGIYNQVELDIPKIRFLDSLWRAERYDTVWSKGRFAVLRRPY